VPRRPLEKVDRVGSEFDPALASELEAGVELWVPPAALDVAVPFVPFVPAEPLRPFLPAVPF